MQSSPRNVRLKYHVDLKLPHPEQLGFVRSDAKRIILKAGRRSGKTTGIAIRAVEKFLAGRRVLYGAPTVDQVGRFWTEVKQALREPIEFGVLRKNESNHTIEIPGTEVRIKAKTAWNADSLRGDYADELILDEWQLMNEDAWELVGAPMLLDNNGNATFIYTPPSRRSTSATKAKDPRHASKMFKKAEADTSGRWKTFHFSSHDNPHLSVAGLEEIKKDMTVLAYKQEIMAEDLENVPGALWTQLNIDNNRVSLESVPKMVRIVVGIDPSATSNPTSDEAGIIVGGLGADGNGYVLKDSSLQASPDGWARAAVKDYQVYLADRIVAETNNGGEMVELTVRTIDKSVSYKGVHASRGKVTRAEPVAALSEQNKIKFAGVFEKLEDELCNHVFDGKQESPNRLDAMVWVFTELMLGGGNLGFLEYLQNRAAADEAEKAKEKVAA